MAHISLSNLSILTNLEKVKIKEALEFSTFRVIPPESRGAPILQGRTKSGEVLYFFPGRFLKSDHAPAAPLIAQGSIIDAWIQIRGADPEQRENLRQEIEDRINAMNAATLSSGATRVWARLAKLRDEALSATYKELIAKQNLTEEASLKECAVRAGITPTAARRIITRITKLPVPNPKTNQKIISANIRKQREDSPEYLTRLHIKAKKEGLKTLKGTPQYEHIKKQKQIAHVRANQKGLETNVRMEDLLVLKGAGVDEVVYGLPTHCPMLNIPLDYTESKPAKGNMARVWRLYKEGSEGAEVVGLNSFGLVPPNVAVVSHLYMTLLDNALLTPEKKEQLLAALKEDMEEKA